MTLRPRLAALAAVLVLLFAVTGCFDTDTPEVRLGFVATFSGDSFRAGRDALEAARFAVAAANKAGTPTLGGKPCRVSLFIADDKASPEDAAAAVKYLVSQKHVMAIIGPYPSDLADAAALAAEAEGVPLIAPAATAAVVTARRPHIFRIAFTDSFQGAVLGHLASRRLGLSRVVIIANANSLSSMSLSEAYARNFTACGGHVTVLTYEDRDRNFGPLMAKALADHPQGLFLPNSSKESVLLGLAARKAGFTGLLLGGDAWDGPEVSGLAAFEGSYFVDHWREDSPGQTSEAYVAAFKEKMHHAPTELGALTQDAVGVVLAAVQQSGSLNPEVVTKALMDLPPYNGVTGRFDFVDDGNPFKSLYVAHIDQGSSRISTQEVPPPESCR